LFSIRPTGGWTLPHLDPPLTPLRAHCIVAEQPFNHFNVLKKHDLSPLYHFCSEYLCYSLPQRNESCHRRSQNRHSARERCSLIRDDSLFQTTFRIPAPDMHSTAIPDCPLPATPPPEWTSLHHWYRHRHRASNERLAARRVADWLNHVDHDAALPPSGELDRHDVLVVHEHRCRLYYLP